MTPRKSLEIRAFPGCLMSVRLLELAEWQNGLLGGCTLKCKIEKRLRMDANGLVRLMVQEIPIILIGTTWV